MAIAYDNSGSDAAVVVSTRTWSYTVGVGTNRLLLLGIYSGADLSTSTVTYAGVSMTYITGQTQPNGERISMWYLYNPSSGANNVVWTSAGGSTTVGMQAVSYSGVSQSGFPDAQSTASGTSLTSNFSLTSVADNAWQTLMMVAARPYSSSSGLTVRQNAGFGVLILDTNAAKTPAGAVNVSTTQTQSNDWGGIFVSFAPAVAAATKNNLTLLGVS